MRREVEAEIDEGQDTSTIHSGMVRKDMEIDPTI